MKSRLSALIYTNRTVFLQETRNYAGHSKWQNIKATKQQQDTARSQLFQSLSAKMKVAVAGGDPDPESNVKLAALVDKAKKANMPASTLKIILERLRNPIIQGQMHIIPIRCASGVVLILYIMTEKLTAIKININHILKKYNAKTVDITSLTMFDCASYIVAFKNCSLDQAMEDAIQVDAQDVEEIKDDDETYFQFKGEFMFPEKISSRLTNLGYSILSMDNSCTPTTMIDLSEKEFESIDKLKSKLMSELQVVKKIEDNIASSIET